MCPKWKGWFGGFGFPIGPCWLPDYRARQMIIVKQTISKCKVLYMTFSDSDLTDET